MLIPGYSFCLTEKSLSFKGSESDIYANIDAFHFENAINNIIDNAIKYGGQNINISLESIPNGFILTIADNGTTMNKMDKDKIFAMLPLSNNAVVTSGDYEKFVIFNGIRYSHIIDPRTGYGISIPRTVTVIAENVTAADVMASALSVTGPDGFVHMEGLNMKAFIIQEVEGKLQKWEWGKIELIE